MLLLTFVTIAGQAQKLTPFTGANGLKGYKDDKGHIVVPAQYTEAADFSEGFAAVRLGKKYGYINRNGATVIQPQYDSAAPFFLGYAKVVRGKESLDIDSTGTAHDFIAEFIADLDFLASRELKALGRVNMSCGKFSSGNYNGETFINEAYGYGTYLFDDSSFYCGHFTSGRVDGNGVFYDKATDAASIGQWESGKLKGDYYVMYLKDYKVQVYTATTGDPLFRAGMNINGKFAITSTLIHPFSEKKHNLINILDASGISTMYSTVNSELLVNGRYASFDSQGEVLKVNTSNNGVYVDNVSTQSFNNSSVITDAEKSMGYKIPTILYPEKLINNYWETERYFGKAEGSTPRGFGSLSSSGSNYHLLTGMFDGNQINGFKQEIFNGEQKYFYAGNFEETHDTKTVIHKGNDYGRFIYDALDDVAVAIGSTQFDGANESYIKGILVNIGPKVTSVTFLNNEAGENNGKGYLMLPLKNIIYRGGLIESTANGVGEVSSATGVAKGKYLKGKLTDSITDMPSWITPNFTNMFDKPFGLIEDK